MALGARVRFYREYRKWTLEDLAERSSVDVGTISALENRKSKRSNFAQALATAFGLSIEQLVDESRNWLADYAPPPRGTLTDLSVREPEAKAFSNWPFPGISPAEWERLTPEDRAEVQGFARGLLLRRKHHAAQA